MICFDCPEKQFFIYLLQSHHNQYLKTIVKQLKIERKDKVNIKKTLLNFKK